MASLSIALTELPFPYGALALASYAGIPISFDGEAKTSAKDTSGSAATGHDEVLDTLAKGTNISGATASVSPRLQQ